MSEFIGCCSVCDRALDVEAESCFNDPATCIDCYVCSLHEYPIDVDDVNDWLLDVVQKRAGAGQRGEVDSQDLLALLRRVQILRRVLLTA